MRRGILGRVFWEPDYGLTNHVHSNDLMAGSAGCRKQPDSNAALETAIGLFHGHERRHWSIGPHVLPAESRTQLSVLRQYLNCLGEFLIAGHRFVTKLRNL